MSIYIVAHRPVKAVPAGGFLPIYVGEEMQGHPQHEALFADNIHEKNSSFCELTALYAIWKNCHEPVLGLCHYRRFFLRRKLDWWRRFYPPHSFLNLKNSHSIIDSGVDLILPVPVATRPSVLHQYRMCHQLDDLMTARNIIAQHSPEYLYFFDVVMSSGSFHPYNMLITKKEVLNQYCDWLFSVLFALEEELDLTHRDEYQQRVYGFIAERLLDVWQLANSGLKVIKRPVVQYQI